MIADPSPRFRRLVFLLASIACALMFTLFIVNGETWSRAASSGTVYTLWCFVLAFGALWCAGKVVGE